LPAVQHPSADYTPAQKATAQRLSSMLDPLVADFDAAFSLEDWMGRLEALPVILGGPEEGAQQALKERLQRTVSQTFAIMQGAFEAREFMRAFSEGELPAVTRIKLVACVLELDWHKAYKIVHRILREETLSLVEEQQKRRLESSKSPPLA
jgi:hypothetical protein